MTAFQSIIPAADAQPAMQVLRKSEIPDDKDMLRAAADLTRDISTARPEIYWPDMLVSAALGFGALAGAIVIDNVALAIGLGLVSVLALYRALLFIHDTMLAQHRLDAAAHAEADQIEIDWTKAKGEQLT